MKITITNSFERFKRVYDADKNSRWYSYDYCRETFINYVNGKCDEDKAALCLYYYLASWGMLRNSFLMQKDYRFLVDVVRILKKYKQLNCDKNSFYVDPETMLQAEKEMIDYFENQKYYKDDTNLIDIKNVSKILTTKILLGTYGCIIAYDTNVTKGLKEIGVLNYFTRDSIKMVNELLKTNQSEIKQCLKQIDNDFYTPMKVLDMYLFYVGLDVSLSERITRNQFASNNPISS